MKIEFAVNDNNIEVCWNNIWVEVPKDSIYIGHIGCKLLGTLPKVSQELENYWNNRFGNRSLWKNTKDAKGKLATTLDHSIKSVKMQGAVLWDTMRKGSDFWRPGKLILDAVELLPAENPYMISYSREDFLCPPKDLLQSLMKTNMPFAEFATRYSEYLRAGNILKIAMASVLLNLARNQLPIFYCVDPYIPGYGRKQEYLSDIPYAERTWLQELRTEGCHRIVLVEEIARGFLRYKIPVTVVGLETTSSTSHIKKYE